MSWYRNKSKFGNKRIGGYASKLEMHDAMWLKSLQDRGIITDLKEQVRFDFIINGKKLKHYSRVDFQFERNGKVVWAETKGFPTDVYLLKREIIETTLPDGHVYLVNPNEADILAIA